MKLYGPSYVLKLLMDAGANPNKADNHKMTPLHYAAMYGSAEVVKTLLDKGAEPNSTDENGWTPLHYATKWVGGRTEVIQALLDGGADPEKTSYVCAQTQWKKKSKGC